RRRRREEPLSHERGASCAGDYRRVGAGARSGVGRAVRVIVTGRFPHTMPSGHSRTIPPLRRPLAAGVCAAALIAGALPPVVLLGSASAWAITAQDARTQSFKLQAEGM